jgi:hypothetical protein
MMITLTLVYQVENEKTALDLQREIFDYANKGLRSVAIDIHRKKARDDRDH